MLSLIKVLSCITEQNSNQKVQSCAGKANKQ